MKKEKVKHMSIIDLKKGEKGRVKEIQGGHVLAKKLENMGIRVGSQVRSLSGGFMSGPSVIESGCTQVAIGRGMARKIIVEKA
jgi:ferrous iron transport protein A